MVAIPFFAVLLLMRAWTASRARLALAFALWHIIVAGGVVLWANTFTDGTARWAHMMLLAVMDFPVAPLFEIVKVITPTTGAFLFATATLFWGAVGWWCARDRRNGATPKDWRALYVSWRTNRLVDDP
jgi:hypothetical protein